MIYKIYYRKHFLVIFVLCFVCTANLFSQDIFVNDVCTCGNGSVNPDFIVTFANWPDDTSETYDIVINFSARGGGRADATAFDIRGDSSTVVQIIFSGISTPADAGNLQISSVTGNSANSNLSVSSEFIPYELFNEVLISPPSDTTVTSCLLGDTSIQDFFDRWLMDVSASGGCGNIEITHDWDGTYPGYCQEVISVTFTATDVICGDTAVRQALFKTQDCLAPIPVVANGILSVNVDFTQCVDVNASLFDAGSFDDCGEVKFSYSSTVTDTLRTFCCNANTGVQEVRFWVTDEAGNQDYLVTYLDVQGCHSHGPKITGTIETKEKEGVAGVEVFIEDTASSILYERGTGPSGHYQFFDLDDEESKVVTIRPFKNDDLLNGVNTLDILYIQQHILGLNRIEDPYSLIAANVNDDRRISGADMVELRRAILGIDTEFSNNTSWRFVDAAENLQEGQIPFDYPGEVTGTIAQISLFMNDFTAVKIGDVNSTAQTSFADSVEAEGNNSPLQINFYEAKVEKGGLIEVDVTSGNFAHVEGFQFTLDYAYDALDFVEVKDGVLGIRENNYAHFFEAAILTMSWNSRGPTTKKKHEVLFTLVFRAKRDVSLSQVFQLTDAITKSEAYSEGEMHKLSLRFLKDFKEFNLYQNAPNPFENKTIIRFDLPESGLATLTFYDATGKIVSMIKGEYSAGQNQVKIDREELPMQGLYYYELSTKGHKTAKKMVVGHK